MCTNIYVALPNNTFAASILCQEYPLPKQNHIQFEDRSHCGNGHSVFLCQVGTYKHMRVQLKGKSGPELHLQSNSLPLLGIARKPRHKGGTWRHGEAQYIVTPIRSHMRASFHALLKLVSIPHSTYRGRQDPGDMSAWQAPPDLW